MIKQCRNCKYSFNYYNKSYECRRYPPVVAKNDSALNSTFPMVVSVEQCGEYEPKRKRLLWNLPK